MHSQASLRSSLLLLLTPLVLAQQNSVTSTITVSSGVPQPTGNSHSYTDDNRFRDDMLFAHNFYRGAHNASDLTWNQTSATAATRWSDGCEFEHSGWATGENLAMGYPNATANVDAWALERKDYSWSNPKFDSKTGHFTQLVWRNTTSVGCGRTNCNGENNVAGWLVVCEYWPPGNVLGPNGDTQFFRDNVLRQIEGRATDTVGSGVTSDGVAVRDGLWGAGVLLAAAVAGMGMAW